MNTTPDPAPADPNATVLIGDEVAVPLRELVDSAEKFTHAGVSVPFHAARLLIEQGRKALDVLETQIRKAGGK